MSSRGKPDREEQGRAAYALGGLLLMTLALYAYPELVIALILAGFVAMLMPPRVVDQPRRANWRRIGWLEAGAGGALAVTYLVLRVPLALAGESDRFERAWRDGVHIHADALVRYPWGWAPVSVVIALVAAGVITRWRAR
jgi:hypothetical protein